MSEKKENKYLSSKKLGLIPIDKDEKFIQCIIYSDYYVSNYGRIISNKYNKFKLLSPKRIDSNGYIHYTLRHNAENIQLLAHRIVALNWCKNNDPDSKIEVHHIDKNKSNNYYKNLMWVSKAEHKLLDLNYEVYFSKNGVKFHKFESIESIAQKAYIESTELYRIINSSPDYYFDRLKLFEIQDFEPTNTYFIGVCSNNNDNIKGTVSPTIKKIKKEDEK